MSRVGLSVLACLFVFLAAVLGGLGLSDYSLRGSQSPASPLLISVIFSCGFFFLLFLFFGYLFCLFRCLFIEGIVKGKYER